jgi:hypothetical protein
MLTEIDRQQVGRPKKTSHDVRFLDDVGITPMQSVRWQQEASLPEKELRITYLARLSAGVDSVLTCFETNKVMRTYFLCSFTIWLVENFAIDRGNISVFGYLRLGYLGFRCVLGWRPRVNEQLSQPELLLRHKWL